MENLGPSGEASLASPSQHSRFVVSHLLGVDFVCLRKNLLPQYIGFFKNLFSSATREVQIIANMMSRNVLSKTGRNICLISEEFRVNPWLTSAQEVRSRFQVTDFSVPEEQEWLLPELAAALEERIEREGEGEERKDMDFLTFMIDSFATRYLVISTLFNRPGVAGAVLQSASLLIH